MLRRDDGRISEKLEFLSEISFTLGPVAREVLLTVRMVRSDLLVMAVVCSSMLRILLGQGGCKVFKKGTCIGAGSLGVLYARDGVD